MYRILLFFLLLGSFSVCAQRSNPILSSEDTTAMNNAMNMDADAIDMEDASLKDTLSKAGYALKRLKDVIDMKAKTLWGTSLSQSIRGFQDTTYVLVSPLMKINGNGVLIGLVSKLGEINLFDPIDPYVTIYWVVKPVTDRQMPFKLEMEIDNSESLPDSLFPDIKTAMGQYYVGKTYNEIEECSTDVVQATQLFLNLLKAKIGDTYAPKYMFRVNGNEYRSGHSMSLYEHVANQEDTVVSIYLIDRITKQVVQSGITWDGAEVEAYHAYVDKDSIGTHEITATIEDTLEYTFTLHIIGDDVLSVITQSVSSVFESALVDAMQLLVDSAKAKEDTYKKNKALRENLRKQMIAKIELACGTNASSSATIHRSDSSTFIVQPIPASIKTHHFLGQYINGATAEHLARVAFIFAWTNRQVLLEFTKDASKRAAFRDAVMDDIGTLAADISFSLITQDRAKVKEFLVDFIVAKVNATTTAQLKSK